MSDININVGNFDCGDPDSPDVMVINMGTTYKVGQDYLLNYSWNSALYDSYGMNTDVLLRYAIGSDPYQNYTGILPDNATSFQITGFPPHEIMKFRFEFQVGGGSLCYQYVDVLNSDIVIAP